MSNFIANVKNAFENMKVYKQNGVKQDMLTYLDNVLQRIVVECRIHRAQKSDNPLKNMVGNFCQKIIQLEDERAKKAKNAGLMLNISTENDCHIQSILENSFHLLINVDNILALQLMCHNYLEENKLERNDFVENCIGEMQNKISQALYSCEALKHILAESEYTLSVLNDIQDGLVDRL